MKENLKNFDIIIIGGGLAGLCNAIHLSKFDKKVLLIEKNNYPKHKVCGEYISNEVLPYLEFLDINPFNFGAVKIDRFELSTTKGNLISAKLPLGGFGISRYKLDFELSKKAIKNGVTILKDIVLNVDFSNDSFLVQTKENKKYTSKITIGAFGKRSVLDVKMNRNFIQKKSPYLGVKIHVKGNFPEDLVALHNFKGGYCGVSKVENNAINLCYITNFLSFKKYKNIDDFQQKVVFQNHFLKEIFNGSEAIFEKPLTISQISFVTKNPVENHILMCGDSAGMIHPLCGNGMSMAIQSAQMASKLILNYFNGELNSRNELEKQYIRDWNRKFSFRLKTGHFIAMLFRKDKIAAVLLQVLKKLPFLLPIIIKQTHGKLMKI
ncbi:Dehydrogenase (flavoprotein) [Polaribacter sp. Hel1_33_78]|jgi:flavin-dependent dehydrogenase|uniref:NAD(P)/FAD-dependent oxidoreductase n=1 Tax=unclassified Polaribacter TaxID=196858 RepID=UPI000879EA79|nr:MULTISPECIES: NAD(P)/FAD-dependent oxidoreductase [unclassified Polaribacter]MDG2437548.1 tryptophan 7-halogenase [Polaribacter sp.]PKV66163.1 flavin-dependent dehydrogenase [Polaribacter sp. Hel1_33_96]SDT86990.1 Dehydrogenase (flavoprotein) [Polaribacter sp. Hel1_33_78]